MASPGIYKGKTITAGTDAEVAAQIARIDAAQAAPPAIDAATIGANTKLVVPPVPQFDSAAAFVSSIKPTLASTKVVQDATKESNRLEKTLGSFYDQYAQKGAATQKLYDKYKVEESTKKLQDLTMSIAQRAGEFDKLEMSLEGQGRGIPLSIVTGQQGAVRRQKAVEIGAQAAVAQALQGNIQLSTQLADRAIELEFGDIETNINRTLQFLDLNREKMSAAQQEQAQELQLHLADYQEQVTQAKEEKKQILGLAQEVAAQGQADVATQITRAADIDSAFQLAAPYIGSLERQQAQANIGATNALAGQRSAAFGSSTGTGAYNGEYAATISLAAQQGGTNQQRQQIAANLESFIAQGDYGSAYAQIANSVAKALPGGAGTDFINRANQLAVTEDLKASLQAYAAAGGDTNIFKGSENKIQQRIGSLMTDPEYAALATNLNLAFQAYRQQMSGAAFGIQESRDYGSVLPGPGKTLSLNLANIEGLSSYLNSTTDNYITQVVGEGGVHIKNQARAATVPESVVDPDAAFQSVIAPQQSPSILDSLTRFFTGG